MSDAYYRIGGRIAPGRRGQQTGTQTLRKAHGENMQEYATRGQFARHEQQIIEMTSDKFRAWRERMHWTQAHAAVALGVDPRTVREWEHGVGRVTGKPVSLPPMLDLACRWLEHCETPARPGVNT